MPNELDKMLEEILEKCDRQIPIPSGYHVGRNQVKRLVAALKYVFEDMLPPLYIMTEEERKDILNILKGNPDATKT